MQAYVYSRHVAGVASDSLNANKAELLAENVAVLRSAWRGGGGVQGAGGREVYFGIGCTGVCGDRVVSLV